MRRGRRSGGRKCWEHALCAGRHVSRHLVSAAPCSHADAHIHVFKRSVIAIWRSEVNTGCTHSIANQWLPIRATRSHTQQHSR